MNRIEQLAEDLRFHVFQTLDREHDSDAHQSGRIAAIIESVFLAEMRNENPPRFHIGDQYNTKGKHPYLCKITGIKRTYIGEEVSHCYVSEHEFLEQMVIYDEVPESTVARGIIEQ